ncbi:MAG: nucleoside triphosphate pyrophosphohydrolase [Gemmatimonadales bacterium]
MEENSALERALAMVRDLRARCPWDRVQTRETLRPYLIEEAHELDHALAGGDALRIRHEVADLLLHLAWQLVLAEERGEFTSDDVAGDLERKMRRRHPHLFDIGPAEEWERLKARERRQDGEPGRRGVLDGLPHTLPELLMASRLQERAAGVGFDWPDAAGPAAKVREELAEVEHELETGGHHPEAIDHEIGDLLFSVVNLARKAGVHPGPALERANERFRSRFAAMERIAADRQVDLEAAGLEELDRLWEEVKKGF